MNRDHADAGFLYIADTDLHTQPSYGFTVLTDTVIDEITFPSSYSGDSAIEGVTLIPGYYPIRSTSIDLTSGAILLWLL